MNKIKIFVLTLIVLVVLVVLIVNIDRTDEVREDQVDNFVKMFIPEQTKKCLIKNHYSLDNPTEEQKAECEAYAKTKWDEVKMLNGVEN